MMEDDDEEEENDDDNYRSMFPEYADTAMEDNEEEDQGEEREPDEPADDLGRVISDARRGCDCNIPIFGKRFYKFFSHEIMHHIIMA
jgi:hypothetical protein